MPQGCCGSVGSTGGRGLSGGDRVGSWRGALLSGLHRKEQWLVFAASLAEGETIREGRPLRDCALHIQTVNSRQRQDMPANRELSQSIRRLRLRACEELFNGELVKGGFGISNQAVNIVAARDHNEQCCSTIENGAYGGMLPTGTPFGYVRNTACMINGTPLFDFNLGGGVDANYSISEESMQTVM